MLKNNIKVIALGGSLVNPGKPDVIFLNRFKKMIVDLIKKENYRFLIVVGGGKICRIFQRSLKKIIPSVSNNDLDWLGIKVTHLNAYFVASVFGNLAQKTILKSFNSKIIFYKDIIIGGGVKPGHSTDYDAFYWGSKVGIKEIYLPTNVGYIFDKDPNKFTSAKRLDSITWSEYINLITDEWSPGLNIPIDQKAAHFAKENKMIAYVFNGSNFKNFKQALMNKKFKGTIVKP
jgi:uridylate kinase